MAKPVYTVLYLKSFTDQWLPHSNRVCHNPHLYDLSALPGGGGSCLVTDWPVSGHWGLSSTELQQEQQKKKSICPSEKDGKIKVFIKKAGSQKWRSKTKRLHDLEVARKPHSIEWLRVLRGKLKHPTSQHKILNIPITATSQKDRFFPSTGWKNILFWHKQGRVMLRQLHTVEQSRAVPTAANLGSCNHFPEGRWSKSTN